MIKSPIFQLWAHRPSGAGIGRQAALVVVLSGLLLASCSSSTTTETTDDTDLVVPGDVVAGESINIDAFVAGALASDATTVDCTLSDGTETTCYQIVTVGTPAGSSVGPFCPESITTSADDAGIWFDGGSEVYQADGNFIVNLPNLYGDSNWNMYDEATGLVNVTDTQEACEAAAVPVVEAQYQNHCVQCSLDYVDGGLSTTYLIPTTPVPLDAPSAISSDVGVSLNGIPLAAPAPVTAILSQYTVAIFDDCGGHINPNAGYHYHAATGCTEVGTQTDGHSALLGYALDGYGIYGRLDADGFESTSLDECRGETDDTRGYHYHVATASENMFIGCFHGATVGTSAGPGGGPPGGGPPQ